LTTVSFLFRPRTVFIWCTTCTHSKPLDRSLETLRLGELPGQSKYLFVCKTDTHLVLGTRFATGFHLTSNGDISYVYMLNTFSQSPHFTAFVIVKTITLPKFNGLYPLSVTML
jgi:hypothetical protein